MISSYRVLLPGYRVKRVKVGPDYCLEIRWREGAYGPKVFIDIVKTVDDRVGVIPRPVILILPSAASFSVVTPGHDLSETAVGKLDG